jgi:hypothetical protein
LIQQAKYNEAEKYLDEVLKIKIKEYGENSYEITPTMNSLAICLKNLKKYTEAGNLIIIFRKIL